MPKGPAKGEEVPSVVKVEAHEKRSRMRCNPFVNGQAGLARQWRKLRQMGGEALGAPQKATEPKA